MKRAFIVAMSFVLMCVGGAIADDEKTPTVQDWFDDLSSGSVADHQCAGGDAPDSIACFSSCGVAAQGHRIFVAFSEGSDANKLRFCATNVYAYRAKKSSDPWTLYNKLLDVGVPGPECFTLYKDGSSAASCDVAPLVLSNYANASWSVVSVETGVLRKTGNYSKVYDCSGCSSSKNPWYSVKGSGHYGECGAVNDHEHDMILGIRKFTEDTHGAEVQPMVVRAYCSTGEKGNSCSIVIKPVGDVMTLCMAGFKLENGKCVPASQKCGIMGDCTGWKAEDFAGSQYTRVVTPVSDKEGELYSCYEYRCADSNYGFQGDLSLYDENRKCVECVSSDTVHKYINSDGICKELADGQIVSSETGEAVTASKINQEELRKCWKNSYPDEWKNCVLGLGQ